MKHKIVSVKNLQRLAAAYAQLKQVSFGMPKIGLVHSVAGHGKTWGIGWLADQNNGVFVTATPVWTPSTMLRAILKELALDEATPGNQGKLDAIVQALLMGQQPLFVDEADFVITRDNKMLETLRSIHDLAGVPVILVGMDRIDGKLKRRKQFDSRIAQRVLFAEADAEDTAKLAQELLNVEVADDLLEHLRKAANGNFRLISTGLAKIEGYAHVKQQRVIDLAAWKASGKDFF